MLPSLTQQLATKTQLSAFDVALLCLVQFRQRLELEGDLASVLAALGAGPSKARMHVTAGRTTNQGHGCCC